jgi:DNA replication protein DnaC
MKTPNESQAPTTPEMLRGRVQRLALHGLIAHWTEVADKPWVAELCAYEERERHRRSLERRLREARIGAFKSMVDFDWSWPKKIDKDTALDLLSLRFIEDGINAILLGPNGVGKTMLLRNIAHQLRRSPE